MRIASEKIPEMMLKSLMPVIPAISERAPDTIKQASIHHQNSARDARPLNSAYLLITRFTASTKPSGAAWLKSVMTEKKLF